MNPTRARLDLLQAVADGAVERRYPVLPERVARAILREQP